MAPKKTQKKTQTLTQTRMRETLRAGRDPIYFIQNYCKIQHPKRGIIKFDTFPFQDDVIRDYVNNQYNIVLKARQLGLSTITAAFVVWLAMFHKGKSILVLATKKDTAMNFFKKVKLIISHVPKWMVLSPIVKSNQSELEFESGSNIKAISTSDDAGRSESLSLLVLDECVGFNTKIWLRSKKTGEVKSLCIGELFSSLSDVPCAHDNEQDVITSSPSSE